MSDESLNAAINAMMTCTPLECSRESHCLLVAKKLRDLLDLNAPHRIEPEPEPDPGVITDYAPTWECPGC